VSLSNIRKIDKLTRERGESRKFSIYGDLNALKIPSFSFIRVELDKQVENPNSSVYMN
jgi:hypothetical protein